MLTRREIPLLSALFALGGSVGAVAQDDRLPAIAVRGSEVTVSRQLIIARPDLPVPADPGMLFYVQHSINKNQIVYAARQNAAGKLDRDEPVEAFWRRFDEDGRRRALTFFERVFAFGVRVSPLPDERFQARIAGYRDRGIVVDLDGAGKPRGLLTVGQRTVRLVYAYAVADDSGFIPKVHHVDFHGFDIASGEAIRERIRLDM
ncbi:DUF4833 domain-containing protein [Phreatobacter aquaticus]|nr:DUF4833 domain-containing protein [Phreatobacter aquaticus]